MPGRAKTITPDALERDHRAALEAQGKRPPALNGSIYLYTGPRGAGKSLSLVDEARKGYANGVRVVHNGSLFFGEELDIHGFLDNRYSNCIVVFDELEEWLNNLRTGSNFQMDFISVMIQLRHVGCLVLASTQYPSEINSRFLRRVDWHVRCRSSTAGKSVWQGWQWRPWIREERERRIFRRRVVNATYRSWQLFDTQRWVATGAVRGINRAASSNADEINAVWSVIVDAAVKGEETISAEEVVLALFQRSDEAGGTLPITTRKAGGLCRALGCTLKRDAGGRNRWRVPLIPGVNAPENLGNTGAAVTELFPEAQA